MAFVVTEKMIEAAAYAIATKGANPLWWGPGECEWYARIALTGAAEHLEEQRRGDPSGPPLHRGGT